ncbi:hypothetical protein ACHHYP_03588 [Achlya hypogyna]|uniref:Uncharacterized protein n=1 Tax=Achlya hypogyna TaxID=1202772 RepID=A0A1V9ZR06_ACHHY|nr:hypothetical protein ACHHYP_03588 [Achlya hypogyna]
MQQELEAAHDGLFLAAEHGRADVLKALLDHGKDVLKLDAIRNAEGLTPLHVAVACQKTDAVRALLSAGFAADVVAVQGAKASKYTHKTAYEIAIGQLPHKAMMQVFIQYIVQHVAMNDVTKVEELLRAGIEGDIVTDGPPHQNTLLHWAACSNAVEVLTLLLEKYGKTDLLNKRNAEGATALHEACHGNHVQCVQLLVNHGADLTITGTHGYSKGKAAIEVATNKDITRIIAKGKIVKQHNDDDTELSAEQRHDEDRQVLSALATSPRAQTPPPVVPRPPISTSASTDAHVRLQIEEKDALIAQLKESMETLVADANDRRLLGEHEVVLDYIRKLRAEKTRVERQLYDTEEHVVVQEEQMMELKAQIRANTETIEALRQRIATLESGPSLPPPEPAPMTPQDASPSLPRPPTVVSPPPGSQRRIEARVPPPKPDIADVFDYASVHAKALAEPESFWKVLLQFLWPFGNTATVEESTVPRDQEVIMTV